jgi:hypothetical protein
MTTPAAMTTPLKLVVSAAEQAILDKHVIAWANSAGETAHVLRRGLGTGQSRRDLARSAVPLLRAQVEALESLHRLLDKDDAGS